MSFESDLKRIADRLGKSLEYVVGNTAMALFNSVVEDTPVDSGRARGNWQVSKLRPVLTVKQTLDPGGTAAKAEIARVSRSIKPGEVLWLTNNLPYIRHLEFGLYGQGPGATEKTVYGYSRQAPVGMVRKNVYRFKMLVEQEVRKHKI